MNCDHEWIANSGRGGKPSFRVNRHMGSQPIMSVACLHCSGRTWLTEAQWMAHLEARAEIEQIGEEVEGRGPETAQTLTEENGQLRARIAELEDQIKADALLQSGYRDRIAELETNNQGNANAAKYWHDKYCELEAQVRTAGAEAKLEEISTLSKWARTQGTSVISESFRGQFLELMERRSHVLSEEARRLRGEGE